MKEPKRYTVTSALPYANGPAHIGHIAGAYLPADIYVRYLRSLGKDVLYVCGSDEHGAAITLRAKKEGISPREIVDKYHGMIGESMSGLGISFDIYHRTSSELHHETAAEYFKTLEAKGAFTQETREQYYDEEAQQFLADRYISGECPKEGCGNPKAYGDQCERCGSALSPTDLINPKSTLTGATPVLKPTTHWYLPMQDHEEWLKEWILEGKLDGEQHHDPKAWKDHVLGQCRSWLESGLQPRAMTRDLDWGVNVPLSGADGKVLYVWLDAPIGYISASKQWAADHNKDWKPYWQDEETKLVHFIGKDNIVFHCIIFPILLKAHGDFILPENVPANAFMNLEESKISTSRNWAVWVHEYLEQFPGKEDVLRYTLTSLAPENRDSEFKWQLWADRNNNELVNGFGNFTNRTLVLTHKNFDGKIPQPSELQDIDRQFLADVAAVPTTVGQLIADYKMRDAQTEMMRITTFGDVYLSSLQPWKLLKTGEQADRDRAATILWACAQATAILAAVSAPFLPNTSEKLFGYLNLDPLSWEDLNKEEYLAPSHAIERGEHLFSPIDDAVVQQQVDLLAASQQAAMSNPDAPEVKEEISFDQFGTMDLRVGKILEAERIPKRDRLLKLKVDVGREVRTIVSGIAEHFKPEELAGRRVSVLVNLKPAKLGGVLSEGMILMAEDKDKKLSFVTPEGEALPGSVIR